MAAAEPSNDHTDSLPLIDLRLLSQSELYTLSLSAATHLNRRSDDDSVIPKIDRSIFNESAGSRKQTFSRLPFGSRKKQNSPVPASSSFSSFHIPLQIKEPLDEEKSQIIGLLQRLFGVESLRNANRLDNEDDARLVPVQVEFKQPSPESAPFAYQNIPIDVINDSQRKRKRGRPRRNENLEIVSAEEPRKVDSDCVEKEVAMVNERGFVADRVGLGDPGEELIRRTHLLETESQLLDFLESLNGQ